MIFRIVLLYMYILNFSLLSTYSLPWSSLVEPSVKLARNGIKLDKDTGIMYANVYTPHYIPDSYH